MSKQHFLKPGPNSNNNHSSRVSERVGIEIDFCFHFSIPKSLPPRVGATRLSSTPWWTSCGCYSWQSNTSSQWLHSPPSSKNTNHPSEGKKMMKKNLCPLTAGILMNLVPIHFFRPSSGRETEVCPKFLYFFHLVHSLFSICMETQKGFTYSTTPNQQKNTAGGEFLFL